MHWIRCFAHILNLIAQVILHPFGSHKKNPAGSEQIDLDSDELDANKQSQGLQDSDSEEDQESDNNTRDVCLALPYRCHC
ncbi:hypothetical protein PSTG_12046 [Puccinia striiformis f. sp. tritici PST-78]|uniref:Uncharacterized protein n=1 Tax=Puccinia striiformis f. sp. tritici PST-78 TaxID=1165861 RepID=A0A0L0V5P3_9BASI|nr:hypothetical protein PSTG_12046 [Puccinia striiformis f. sp. tritici PST-78]